MEESSLKFNLKVLEELLDFMGGDTESVVTVEEFNGHSGPGLYAYFDEYTEEGAAFLGSVED